MVKSATRTLQILKAVGSTQEGLKHFEIAKALNIPKGSLSLLLADLTAEGFLRTDAAGKCYKIGPQILTLAGHFLSSLDVVKLSTSIIRTLSANTNESAGLAVKMGWDAMVVCKESSQEPFKWDLEIGTRYPMYSTAAGKAILAHLTEEELHGFFKNVSLDAKTDHTITDKKTLLNQLEKIRSGALAYAIEEQYDGMIALAGPVFNNEGRVVASIVQPMPTLKFNADKEKIVTKEIRLACETLSIDMGYQGSTT